MFPRASAGLSATQMRSSYQSARSRASRYGHRSIPAGPDHTPSLECSDVPQPAPALSSGNIFKPRHYPLRTIRTRREPAAKAKRLRRDAAYRPVSVKTLALELATDTWQQMTWRDATGVTVCPPLGPSGARRRQAKRTRRRRPAVPAVSRTASYLTSFRGLPQTPAEATGLVQSAMTVSDIVNLIDARAEPPKPRGPYKPRQPKVV